MTDPVASPKPGQDQQTTPFWRSRIIALYIDWAKTFAAFRDLPHSDKVALITNHASSYMIMCKAFRTPERTLMDDGFYADRAFPQEGEPQSNEMLRNSREQQHSLSTGVICSAVPRSFSTPALGNHFFYDNPHRHEQQQKLSYLSEQANISLTTFSAMNIMKNVATECCQRQQLEEQQDMLQKRNMHAFFEPTIVSFENKNGINDISINGLTPVMTAMIDLVMKPFRRLNITTTEFAALQAVMFFDPDTEGLDSASQRNVSAEQKKLLTALYRHICGHYSLLDASDRFASILLRIPTIRKVAAKKNETLQIIDLFNLSNINSLVKETALGIRSTNAGAPTVLSAMDADFKPIL
ncbi:hypothetical protein AB6A40_010025 [Gnathostoma spinigerum]|uniref:NR LBD domain-containing protein n=1 Tax=Gnathostoma spinigerum TaxID=75299 RepID=A0ABD6ETX8_9BILA